MFNWWYILDHEVFTRIYPDITFWLFSLFTKFLHNVNRMSESRLPSIHITFGCIIFTWKYVKFKISMKLGRSSSRNSLTVSHSLIHSLSSYWTTFVFMSMLKSHSHTLTLSLSFSYFYSKVTFSLSHSLTLTLSHSLVHSVSTCWTTFVFMSRLKSHCL